MGVCVCPCDSPGVVDENVKLTQWGEERFHGRRVPQVDAVLVDPVNGRALRFEQVRDRAPDPLGRSGDDGGLPVEMSHVSVFFLLLMRYGHIADGPVGTECPVDVH